MGTGWEYVNVLNECRSSFRCGIVQRINQRNWNTDSAFLGRWAGHCVSGWQSEEKQAWHTYGTKSSHEDGWGGHVPEICPRKLKFLAAQSQEYVLAQIKLRTLANETPD